MQNNPVTQDGETKKEIAISGSYKQQQMRLRTET